MVNNDVQRQNIKNPKGILLTLLGVLFRLSLIIISSTLLLMIWRLIESALANQLNIIDEIISVINLETVRIKIFCNALPLMTLIVVIFLVDGLVQRDIRKFQFARESTYLFHRTKLYLSFFLYSDVFLLCFACFSQYIIVFYNNGFGTGNYYSFQYKAF